MTDARTGELALAIMNGDLLAAAPLLDRLAELDDRRRLPLLRAVGRAVGSAAYIANHLQAGEPAIDPVTGEPDHEDAARFDGAGYFRDAERAKAWRRLTETVSDLFWPDVAAARGITIPEALTEVRRHLGDMPADPREG